MLGEMEGTTTAVLFDEILKKAPIAPVLLHPERPDKLEEIVNRSLEKDRYSPEKYPSVFKSSCSVN